jgi:alkyldihydroxyacetonephosphate synthase
MPLTVPSRLDEPFARRLESIVGAERVSRADVTRALYGRDCWPKTLLWTKQGRFPYAPDVVVWPESTAHVADVIRACAEAKVAVVPFGGGGGVCGGVVPLRGGVALDLKRMNRFLSLDAASGVADFEAGILGQHLEDMLEARGYTLGHFPSSIYISTLGGFIAARSAGQLSTRYGKIEDMVVSMECVTGTGDVLDTRDSPALLQALIGNEGTLSVVTRARLRVHRQPEAKRFRGYMFSSLEDAFEAMRAFMQRGARPAVVRLYDPLDTALGGMKKEKAAHGKDDRKGLLDVGAKLGPLAPIARAIETGLADVKPTALRLALSYAGPIQRAVAPLLRRSQLILGFEGPADLVAADAQVCHEACVGRGASDEGSAPGERWLENRYKISYRQSRLFANGCFVDTMEVATTWDKLTALYEAVREAVREHALIIAHFSHVYAEGSSIYFTFVGTAADDASVERKYDEVWSRAMEAVQKVGAGLSHHHGVGLSKASRMERELGEGMRLFRALKDIFDPHGIMNPGKMGL